jgi:hypothetical protein
MWDTGEYFEPWTLGLVPESAVSPPRFKPGAPGMRLMVAQFGGDW